MEVAKHLCRICLQCWQQINDFQNFQISVMAAQTFLDHTLEDVQPYIDFDSRQTYKQHCALSNLTKETRKETYPNLMASDPNTKTIKTEPLDVTYEEALECSPPLVNDSDKKFAITDANADISKFDCMSAKKQTTLPLEVEFGHNQTIQHLVLPKLEITDINSDSNTTNFEYPNAPAEDFNDSKLKASHMPAIKLKIKKTKAKPEAEHSDDELLSEMDATCDYEISTPSSTGTTKTMISAQTRANDKFVADIRRKYKEQDLNKLVAECMPSLKCIHCSEQCPTYSCLRQHFLQQHASEDFYMQCFCSMEKLKSREQIKDHFILHRDVNFFTCSICNRTKWTTMKSLLNHFTRKHGEYLKYACSICSKCFTKQGSLTYHYRTIHNADIQGKQLTISPSSTEAEINTKYVNDIRLKYKTHTLQKLLAKLLPTIKCGECSVSFPSYGLYRKHFLKQHPTVKFYIICFCSEVKLTRAFKDHFIVHEEADFFKCGICGHGSGKTMTLLFRHLGKFHSESLHHICKICGNSFSSNSGLTNHYFKQHQELKLSEGQHDKSFFNDGQHLDDDTSFQQMQLLQPKLEIMDVESDNSENFDDEEEEEEK